MEIMNNIRNIRKKHNLSQAQVAEILETTQQQYSKYENGMHEVPIRHIIKLCHYYDVSSDELLGIQSKRVDENVNALQALDYINKAVFCSYSEFIRQAQNDNKLDFVLQSLGKLWTYVIVSEKLGIPIDRNALYDLDEPEE